MGQAAIERLDMNRVRGDMYYDDDGDDDDDGDGIWDPRAGGSGGKGSRRGRWPELHLSINA